MSSEHNSQAAKMAGGEVPTPSSLFALLEAVSRVEQLPERNQRPVASPQNNDKQCGLRAGLIPPLPTVPAPFKSGAAHGATSSVSKLLTVPRSAPKLRSAPKPKGPAKNPRTRHTIPTQDIPTLLMALLEDPKNSDTLTWLPDGAAFVVLRPQAFESEILPRHFNMTSLGAFSRRLEQLGFFPGAGGSYYRHPMFRRGDWDSCGKIRCRAAAAGGGGARSVARASPVAKLSRPGADPRQDGLNLGVARRLQLAMAIGRSIEARRQQRPLPPPAALRESPPPSSMLCLTQSVVDSATKSIVGAAVEAMMRDRRRPGRQLLPADLAARTSELIARSACRGPTGLAKERIKAEILGQPSSRMGRELASILRQRKNKNPQQCQLGADGLAAILQRAVEHANLGK